MKNAVVVLFALFFCAGACPQKGKSPMTQGASAGTQESPQKIKIVDHRFRSGDDYIVMFFDDGSALWTDKVLTDQGQDKIVAYKKYPTHLQISKDFEIQFFDGFGSIKPGWEIINRYRVYSNRQITDLIPDLSKANLGEDDNVRHIEGTCLILLPFKQQEADNVFHTEMKFKEMGIETVLAKDDRFLSFKLFDGQPIAVDTRAKQNGAAYAALLYRKGYIPIMINIVGNNEYNEQNQQIEDYLSESGDGGPPFERWKSDDARTPEEVILQTTPVTVPLEKRL